MTWLSRTSFRHPDFRALALGQAFSWLGDSFQPIALAVGVVASGGSVGDLGLPMAALMIGRIVFSLVGGVLGDRLQPVALMAAASAVRALIGLAGALLFLTDRWNPTNLALLMAVSGAVSAVFHPAFSTLKPRVVPDGEQQQSNASLAAIQHVTRTAGPLLAGALVGLHGPAVGFVCNSLAYAVSGLCVLRVRARPGRAEPATFRHDLREGLAAITSRRWLAGGILGATLFHVGNGALMVLLPAVVIRDLGGGTALGIVEASMALGSLAGVLLAARWRVRRPIAGGFVVLVLNPLAFLALARPESLPLLALALAAGFGALMVFDVWWETTIQQRVPGHQLARVNAWDQMASLAVFPLGTLLAGPLTEAYGTALVIVGAVGVLLLGCALPLLVRDTWRLRRVEAVAPGDAPEFARS